MRKQSESRTQARLPCVAPVRKQRLAAHKIKSPVLYKLGAITAFLRSAESKSLLAGED